MPAIHFLTQKSPATMVRAISRGRQALPVARFLERDHD
jgi:hypothetical protein